MAQEAIHYSNFTKVSLINTKQIIWALKTQQQQYDERQVIYYISNITTVGCLWLPNNSTLK